jgi:hypothetical protein
MTAPAKRGRGRPPASPTGELTARYQVRLVPSLAERIRQHGDGSLTAGIVKLAKRLKTPT